MKHRVEYANGFFQVVEITTDTAVDCFNDPDGALRRAVELSEAKDEQTT